MTETTAEFVVYIINAIANKKDLYPSYVYKKLQETDCIQNYLVSFYDVLHTMGTEAIINDVEKYLNQRGVSFTHSILIMSDNDLEQFYKEHLEEDIIKAFSSQNNISLEESMNLYYGSKLANEIHEGRYGLQYLDYSVLVNILQKELNLC